MPAIASLEELNRVERQLDDLKNRHPEAYGDLVTLLQAFRGIGYRNICRLVLGETTPRRLKGGD
jgi:hypothetical protein